MTQKKPEMKEGQVYQIDGRAAEELEETMVVLNNVGPAIKSLHNVLIEINIEENCGNVEFLHLKTYEKHNIQMAIGLLGELTSRETFRMAERFGLENPC